MEKSGVVWFFRELSLKNVELCDFFRECYANKYGDTWLFRENVEKNRVLAFFHVLI